MQCKRPWFDSWVGKIPRRTDRLPTPVFLGFPGGSVGKESACNVGDLGSIPGLERSSGGGHGYLLQYSCLENLHGQRSLVGYSPWACKELDMTEILSIAQHSSFWVVEGRRRIRDVERSFDQTNVGWPGKFIPSWEFTVTEADAQPPFSLQP